MNSLKLQLENFQSITHGELEFKTGLNFIIGQSNSGKSATFRALKACLLNPSGSQRFIKNGYTALTVTLSYNDNVITWKKTSKENSYTVNGEEYVKTGRANAFKLIENTGFVQGESEAIMNIEEELQLPFPFGLSKSEFFKLYENIFCVSDSATILKSAKEHENKVKFDLDLLEVELKKNETKASELSNFKEEIDLDELKGYLATCKSNQTKLNALRDGLDVIKQAVKFADTDFSIAPFNTENKIQAYDDLQKISKTIGQLKQLHSLSKSLPLPVETDNNVLTEYKQLVSLKKVAEQLKQFDDVSIEPVDFKDKLSKYRNKVELRKTMTRLKELNNIKVPLTEFNNLLTEYKKLKEFKSSLTEIRKKVKSKEAEAAQIQQKVSNLEEKLKEFKVCPLCHRPLDKDEHVC